MKKKRDKKSSRKSKILKSKFKMTKRKKFKKTKKKVLKNRKKEKRQLVKEASKN